MILYAAVTFEKTWILDDEIYVLDIVLGFLCTIQLISTLSDICSSITTSKGYFQWNLITTMMTGSRGLTLFKLIGASELYFYFFVRTVFLTSFLKLLADFRRLVVVFTWHRVYIVNMNLIVIYQSDIVMSFPIAPWLLFFPWMSPSHSFHELLEAMNWYTLVLNNLQRRQWSNRTMKKINWTF